MDKLWSDDAWDDYLYWQIQDRKTLLQGIGKAEPLWYRSGWSRRIDKENRLVFDIVEGQLLIVSCRGHYAK